MNAQSDSRPADNTETLKLTTPSDREVAMSRVFNATRELLFEASTSPDLLKRWLLGPDGWELAICESDLRMGGAIRFVWRHLQGKRKDLGLSGVYKEVTPPERLVFTQVWDEDWTGGETVVTMTFAEHAGKTTLTQTVLYSSRAARDAALKTGMETGVAASYDRLAVLLKSLPAKVSEKGASRS